MKPFDCKQRAGPGARTALTVLAALGAASAAASDEVPADDAKKVDTIVIERRNIFDLDNPDEDKRLYRFANRLHVVTREETIRKQLLFATGDVVDKRLIEETERILRANRYLYDVSVTAKENPAGNIDVHVQTRDVWTLMPEFSFSRSGGENRTQFGFEESNLLGLGQRILLQHVDDVDRTSTSFEFTDRHFGTSWVGIGFKVAENSDGHLRILNVTKPFHALDARRAFGVSAFDNDRREALYVLGDEAAEYRHERRYFSLFGGLSTGLKGGWVQRFTAGFVHDDNRYSVALEPTLPAVIPANRKLVYPYIGVEILEDRFQKTTNTNQIERSEDFFLGTRILATLGWSDTGLGADRDALVYSASASGSVGSLKRRALLWSVEAGGRVERGDSVNATSRVTARYYARRSEKDLFLVLIDALRGHEIDLDAPIEIGGDSGLRGYPLRYQSGDSRMLLTLEQRYYTDWYPWRLFRVGGAIFFDIGRTWGDDPLGGPNLGWLKDVGFGFRLAPTRFGTRKVAHIDIAFPLDGDPSIDDVQILLQAKSSF